LAKALIAIKMLMHIIKLKVSIHLMNPNKIKKHQMPNMAKLFSYISIKMLTHLGKLKVSIHLMCLDKKAVKMKIGNFIQWKHLQLKEYRMSIQSFGFNWCTLIK
jgi:hypothetical protein